MALVLKRGERSRLQFDWRHFRRSRAVEQLHPVVFHVADVTAAYLALYSIADRSSIFWAGQTTHWTPRSFAANSHSR
jgi:hypothetical protein